MTTRKYSSRSQQTTLTAALTSSGTSATVVSGSGLLGGVTISAGEIFTVVIDPDTALEEIVDVTAVSTNTLTIVRGIDGSTGQAHSAGAVVRHMAIGRDYREANTHIEASTGVHGITGSVVGTGGAQTLTDKTLTSPALTTPTIDGLSVQEKVEDIVGAMVAGNTESGIAVTYDDSTGKLNFDVSDPVITLAGDVTGSATITNLGNTTITTTIPSGTIVNADINTSAAIDKTKIAGTAVTVADTGTVTSTMIENGTITNTDINASAGIAYSKLSLTGSITSSDITDGTIVNGDISGTAAIALSKLATDPLARANHTGTQAASTISDFDTQVRTNRLDQMAAPTGAVSANSQKVTNLGTPTLSTDASTKGYVDTQITNLIGAAPSTLDTLAEISAAINSDPNLYATLNNGKLNRDGTQAMTGALPMGTFKITGMGDPTNAQDAATKNYVDTGAASQVAAAAASATAAAASATAADASATSASGSATSATASASSATSSASSATASASAAATSATNAANSATSASNSATTASTQATNAANSASAASTSASNAATSETNAASSATSAAASLDSFDDRYLGSKSSAPTLDNDGNALLTGALYWNSVDNTMYVWSGTAWGSISSTAEIYRYRYVATAGQTTFSGTDANGSTLSYLVGKEQVYLNGVLQVRGTDYTATDGTSIVLASGAAVSDVLEIITFTAFSVIMSAMTDVQNTFVTDQIINGVKVGRGAGSIATNTALGALALNANTTGANNVAIGDSALTANTIGIDNIAIGRAAMLTNTTGTQNTAVGRSALRLNTIGQYNVGLGNNTLYNNTTGASNTSVGFNAMLSNTVGITNVAVGESALYANTTGGQNTAVGAYALDANTTGYGNTAIGYNSLTASVTAVFNTAVGYQSLIYNTTGHSNTALGAGALLNNTTGVTNVAVGRDALLNNTIGIENVAVGTSAQLVNTTGSYNVSLGNATLYNNTTGLGNVAVGHYALVSNTTGIYNTAVGSNALDSNTIGANNTAVGYNALGTNTTGRHNTAVGFSALGSNTIGRGNTAIGAEDIGLIAAALASNTTGNYNVAVGSGALSSQSTGSQNTALGWGSGAILTTGSQNVFLGNQAGYTNTNDLTTGSNNIIIGYNAGTSSATVSNTVTLGNSNITTLRCQVTSITALSDERDKKNIQPLGVGLDFVKTLNPVTFDWNMRDGGKVDVPDTGFIAQELMAAEDAIEMADKLQLTYRDNPEKLEATQGRLIPILVKAIQELAAEVELLKGAK